MRVNAETVAYGAPVVLLALGLILIIALPFVNPWAIQAGWALAILSMMLQSAYLVHLSYPFRQHPLKILRQQAFKIAVIVPQVPLTSASATMLSPLESVPLTMLLASLSCWALYSKELEKKRAKIFGELKEIIDDFTRLNFKPENENEDFTVIRLLEKISLHHRNAEEEDPGYSETTTKVTWVGNSYLVFNSWLTSIRHKVDLIIRNARNLQEGDLKGTVEEFITFHNDYLDRIVEAVIEIVNGSRMEDRRIQRMRFDLFKEKMGQLRYRLNSLARQLRDTGHNVMTEATGLRTELR